jgi:hypothetical protein
LDVLRKQGLLIDLNITGTGMFSKAASWADLGIADIEEDKRSTQFTRGQKILIPDEMVKRLKSVKARMSQALERNSYKITGFAPYRWLPFTAYAHFKTEWEKLMIEFAEVKAEIIADRNKYVDEMAVLYNEIAEASWKSITAQNYDKPEEEWSHDVFVDRIVKGAVDIIPTVDEITTKLSADYVTALVFGGKDTEEVLKMSAAERKLVQAQAEKQYLENQTEFEKVRHQGVMNQSEEMEKQIAIDAMREAELEHAKAQLKEIASPFAEVFSSLRRQMAEDAAEILASIQKNGFVRGKVAERGRGLVDLFNLLAVQDDFELRNQLDALKKAIGPTGADRKETDERPVEEIKGILEKIQELEHSAAQDLIANPSRFSNVEL